MPHRGRKTADSALLAALASGLTIGEAAEKAGISASTAYRRLADPAFQDQLNDLRKQAIERAGRALADAATQAVDCLVALLAGDSEMARLGAARAILEQAAKLAELTDLEKRIATLEAAQKGVTTWRAS